VANLAKWPAPVVLSTPVPGDFCCVPISGWVGSTIEVGQWLNGDKFQTYEHAEVYVGMPDAAGPFGYTISAYPDRAGRKALPCEAAKLPGAYWSSGIVPLTTDQRAGIVGWAEAHTDVGYSELDYLALVAHRLRVPVPNLQDFIGDSGHLICSQYVDLDYSINGVHLFDNGRWPGYVTPMDLVEYLESKSGVKIHKP
jgi:hypothetical protein